MMNPRTYDLITSPINWLKTLIGAFIMSALLATVPLLYTMAQQQLTPADYWFTYYSVNPVRPVFKSGEQIKFYSDRKVDHQAYLEWTDALRCDTNHRVGMGTYSIYKVGRMLEPHPRIKLSWAYLAKVPPGPATCKLISTTTAKLKFADKVQVVESAEFRIE